MKTRGYITYFLFFISMIMLIMSIIPRHHHEDGMVRMRNDLPPDGCCYHQNARSEHCCCNTGCMAIHFFQQTPDPNNSDIQPCSAQVTTLFAEPLFKLLTLPGETGIRQEFIYLESLHGIFITRTTGSRVPLSVFA